METRILIVDDDPFICRQLEELYTLAAVRSSSSAGNCVGSAAAARRARLLAGGRRPAHPGTDGIGLTREIKEHWPDLDVIMITGYASIKGAVEAIKQGASDYITEALPEEEILLAPRRCSRSAACSTRSTTSETSCPTATRSPTS
jgi:DNA-binding NtrC family response regulator